MQAAIRLAVLKARAAHTLDELELYLNEMLNQIEQARERDRQWALNTFGGDEGPDNCAEELADIEHQYDTVFATLLTHSFVVVVYGHFEDSSTRLLNLHRDVTTQPLRLSDFRGNLVERIQRYLAGIRAEQLPEDLVSRLRTLTLVRNCIAHQAGRVSKSANEAQLRKAINSDADLAVHPNGRIHVLAHYGRSSLSLVSDALAALYLRTRVPLSHP